MMALITLGANQETCIATLFLFLMVVLGIFTAYSLLDAKLGRAFDSLMMTASLKMGPGVQYPRPKPAKAYWLFGILMLASFGAFIVTVLQ